MNPLISQFKRYGNLSLEIEIQLSKRIQYFKKRKGDFFLKQGQINSSLFVMKQGLVRNYFRKDEKEINTWFGMENELIASILPLYANQPSFENIQFLEDATIYSISIDDLNEAYHLYPEMNLVGRKIAEELCKVLEERIISFHTESAEERYRALTEQSPELMQRVSLKHIASYLGITQETLSRIRRR